MTPGMIRRRAARIAFQFVGHQPTGTTTLPLDESTEKPYRRFSITPRLDEYVDDVTVLVDGPIEIVLFPANTNEHLVQRESRWYSQTAHWMMSGGKRWR